jgi:hypothetical protein
MSDIIGIKLSVMVLQSETLTNHANYKVHPPSDLEEERHNVKHFLVHSTI